jgi:hypothetical protein
MSVDEQTDTLGLSIISAVKAQGIPSVMGLIQVTFLFSPLHFLSSFL